MREKHSRGSYVVRRLRKSALGIKARGLASLVLFAAAASHSITPPDSAYTQSFEKWKAEMIDDLKQRWLPLAGLFWLKPGANSFGTADDNAVVLPSGPARGGSFLLNGESVAVQVQPGTPAKIDNKVVGEAALQSDITGKPTVIELGSLRMFVITRGTRIGIRVRDLNSYRVRDYKGPIFFPLDMDYRVTATFVASDGKKVIDIPNVLGDVTPTPSPGEVHFKLNGQELTLTALSGDPEQGLSFVISDLTSKTDTYPGGRFLDTDPVVDGKVVLDFNRAYNPPCAVTPYATCPLAPKENRLPIAIAAGEKYDRKHGHT
jgi:uncharacterized protein (DUF1684 family)